MKLSSCDALAGQSYKHSKRAMDIKAADQKGTFDWRSPGLATFVQICLAQAGRR